MTRSEMLQAPLLDLLFENRNKAYGAYALRKYYTQRLTLSLGLCLAVSLLLFWFLASVKSSAAYTKPDVIPDVIVRTQIITEPLQKPIPPKPVASQTSAKPVAQQQYTQPNITPDPVTTTNVPTQIDLGHVAISTQTVVSTISGDIPATPAPVAPAPEPEKESRAPLSAAPQFPGGADAWAAFLSRNLQAPETLDAGEKKTVLVKFLVSEDGSVTGFDVVQSGGAAFDKEVIRVLRKMPKWKPAIQNGHAIAVPFTQPVTFIAMGE